MIDCCAQTKNNLFWQIIDYNDYFLNNYCSTDARHSTSRIQQPSLMQINLVLNNIFTYATQQLLNVT